MLAGQTAGAYCLEKSGSFWKAGDTWLAFDTKAVIAANALVTKGGVS
jgi:hypothetical protein